MKLVDNVMRSFRVAKLFRENTKPINSIDYSDDGKMLVISSEDESITLFECEKGTQTRSLNSKKYGVDLVRFTHAKDTVLHASTKLDDTIRYLSLHDNKYIRYFKGHDKKVLCLHMNRSDDTFLSGSEDKTVRLWDLKSPSCQGLIRLDEPPVASFDPEGLIFAIGVEAKEVRLYDLRQYDKGPFITFSLPKERDAEWSEIKFSPDGGQILVNTSGNRLHLIDAFKGDVLATLERRGKNKGQHLEAAFSPDGQFAISGNGDGNVHVWKRDGTELCTFDSDHHGRPVKRLKWNPEYMTFASASDKLALWLPSVQEE